MEKQQFTKFEVARIIGARALQIAMDAPLLLKISTEELKAIKYDPLRRAEKELTSGALPISIHRPMPRKHKDKLAIKEENISDDEIVAKEQEVEKEIVEDAAQLGFAENTDDVESDNAGSEEI